MPDPLWSVLADPANHGFLAAAGAALLGVLAGPWALIRFAARRPGARRED